MEKIKNFFKEIKWYEYLFVGVCLTIFVTLSVVFKSSIITTLSAILGFLAVFFISKGNVVGQILGLLQIPFYSYISYSNSYYGEFIICLTISFPLYALAIFSWVKNINSSSGDIKVNTKIGWREWLVVVIISLIVGVGVYFLLDYFNTYQVLLSTLSVTTSAIACYIVMRRNGYGFIFYIANNIISMSMWILLVINNHDLTQIITFFNYITYFMLNVRGVFNFAKLKKQQNYELEDASFDKIMKVLKEN